jgi:hypothetical protein
MNFVLPWPRAMGANTHAEAVWEIILKKELNFGEEPEWSHGNTSNFRMK